MKLLSTLSPAETLTIIKGREATLHDLLKVTLLDLHLKKVLDTTLNTAENAVTYQYIHAGKNFSVHRAGEHELIYLTPFARDRTFKILSRHLIEIAFKKADTPSHYQSLIYKSPANQTIFKQNFFQSLFNRFSLTDDGLRLKDKLQQALKTLEKELPKLIASDPDKANHLVQTIGGHVLLLKNVDFSSIPQIDQELIQRINVLKKRPAQNRGDSSGCSSGNDCSGFFGDSGCSASGCSGCGGGCGGD